MMRLRASSAETSGLPVAKPRTVAASSSSSSKTSPDGPSSTISLCAAAAALDLQLVPGIGRAVHDARPPGPDRTLAARHLDDMVMLEAGQGLRHHGIGAVCSAASA